MCLDSKELSDQDGSSEYPQHMFCSRNIVKSTKVCSLIKQPGIRDVYNLIRYNRYSKYSNIHNYCGKVYKTNG